ncbi:transposase [Nonomuraea dietziae]|uniref:transposase n=1 Tax=Nonomuraea dietziae TaxID=65515 RepID=UPI0035E407F6
MRWRVRVGAPWRDVPECYGSWQAVYSLFRRWQRAGLWQQVLPRLPSRILALTTVIWHNDKTSQPITRSLIAYDR